MDLKAILNFVGAFGFTFIFSTFFNALVLSHVVKDYGKKCIISGLVGMCLSLILTASFWGALSGGMIGLLAYYFLCIVADKEVFG